MGRRLYCSERAFALFKAHLPSLETPGGLLRCAVALSMHELDDADPEAVHRQIDELARRVLARAPHLAGGVDAAAVGDPVGDAEALAESRRRRRALLAHLHDELFEVEGFAGNTQEYFDPRNCYVPEVLRTRRGMPITLALVYMCVAARVGLTVRGINAPHHFLAQTELDGKPVLVDPFYRGQILTPGEAFERLDRVAMRPTPRLDSLLRPTTHAQWIARIIQNLQMIFSRVGREADLGAMQELRQLLSAWGAGRDEHPSSAAP